MEREINYNHVQLIGHVSTAPQYSHTFANEDFYTFLLSSSRKSGVCDVLPVIFSMNATPMQIQEGDRVYLSGQLRSYNKFIGGKSRLILNVFAKELYLTDEPFDYNEIELTGHICKDPIYRRTPFAREITDLLVAVRRGFDRNDYLPCIAWGKAARYASTLRVGTPVSITGRVQSREYEKQMDDVIVVRTAYEVSISSLRGQ